MNFVHVLLEQSAAKSPDAIALLHNGCAMTYSELNDRSERVALWLQAESFTPSEPVGIYIGKSIEAVVAIFATLKAGTCYVPIDCNAPLARMEYIVQDCGIRKVITDGTQVLRIEELAAKYGIRLYDCEMECVPVLKAQLDGPPVKETSLAALLYTSGSTGNPKGAMITHGNLKSFLEWAVSRFELQSVDRLLSHAPLQFDISFFDLFAAVAVGASLVLADTSTAANGKKLFNLARDEGITIWQSVPSALTLLKLSNEGRSSAVLSKVRAVLFSGECMPEETLRFIDIMFPNAKLYNIYGCTETNNTFIYEVPRNAAKDHITLPIGAALPYVQYRIVDDAGNDVPDGQCGHLIVATPTMMRGYTDRELTSSVIEEYPGGSGKTLRYYQTQDSVVRRDDGNLYFLGRRDSVIKSNGFRVNLLEVEQHIQKLPCIEETAVFAVPCEVIGNRIIARVRPLRERKVNSLNLKVQCAAVLPKYAIPHVFHISTEPLPKNSNGKVDKRRVSTEWLESSTTSRQKEVLQ